MEQSQVGFVVWMFFVLENHFYGADFRDCARRCIALCERTGQVLLEVGCPAGSLDSRCVLNC